MKNNEAILYYEGALLLDSLVSGQRGKILEDRPEASEAQLSAFAFAILDTPERKMLEFLRDCCSLPDSYDRNLSASNAIRELRGRGMPPHDSAMVSEWKSRRLYPEIQKMEKEYVAGVWQRFENLAEEIAADPSRGPLALRQALESPEGLIHELYRLQEKRRQSNDNEDMRRAEYGCEFVWHKILELSQLLLSINAKQYLEEYHFALKSFYNAMMWATLQDMLCSVLSEIIDRISRYCQSDLKGLCDALRELEKNYAPSDSAHRTLLRDLYSQSDVRTKIEAFFRENNEKDALSRFALKELHNAFSKNPFQTKQEDPFKEIVKKCFSTLNEELLPVSPEGISVGSLPIRQIASGRNFYAVLDSRSDVFLVNFQDSSVRQVEAFHDVKQIAMGFDCLMGLKTDGSLVVTGDCSQTEHAKTLPQIWHGGVALYACEAHSAMLLPNGKLLCMDEHALEAPAEYGSIAEKWENVRQAALSFQEPYAITEEGKLLCSERNNGREIANYFNGCGKRIEQISAFGAYYTNTAVAVLYQDHTVRAIRNMSQKMEDVSLWQNIRKTACGDGFVIGLTADGKIVSSGLQTEIVLYDIADISVFWRHLVVLTRGGQLASIECH